MFLFELYFMTHAFDIKRGETSVFSSKNNSSQEILLQTVKTLMKCSIVLHFIRVYTVCKGKKDIQTN